MIAQDPNRRITIYESLDHPFMKGEKLPQSKADHNSSERESDQFSQEIPQKTSTKGILSLKSKDLISSNKSTEVFISPRKIRKVKSRPNILALEHRNEETIDFQKYLSSGKSRTKSVKTLTKSNLSIKVNTAVDENSLYNLNYKLLKKHGKILSFMQPIGHTKEQKKQSHLIKESLEIEQWIEKKENGELNENEIPDDLKGLIMASKAYLSPIKSQNSFLSPQKRKKTETLPIIYNSPNLKLKASPTITINTVKSKNGVNPLRRLEEKRYCIDAQMAERTLTGSNKSLCNVDSASSDLALRNNNARGIKEKKEMKEQKGRKTDNFLNPHRKILKDKRISLSPACNEKTHSRIHKSMNFG